MFTENFYQNLPPVDLFNDLSRPDVYHPLPADWSVAVSDVKDSTGLIRRGMYKHVNLVGASTIMAVLNLRKSFSLPFIFGGDGAALCIPETLLTETWQALLATRSMARDLYGITLRIGIIPVSYIRERGYDVLVARSRLSSTFTQAAFTGGGLAFAEECLKDPAAAERFAAPDSLTPRGDFTGLECRWQNVPSAHDEIVSLIVQATVSTPEARAEVYRQVLAAVAGIYGDDQQSHPVREENLAMTFRERSLAGESGIRTYAQGIQARIAYWFRIRWNILLGIVLMRMKIRTKFTEWGSYKRRLVENTDFKKFDDKIRQVLSGSVRQRTELTAWLERRHEEGVLVYGVHAAPHALITCLLFDYQDAHVHLVDTDNGGYAIAALQMKEQLRMREK